MSCSIPHSAPHLSIAGSGATEATEPVEAATEAAPCEAALEAPVDSFELAASSGEAVCDTGSVHEEDTSSSARTHYNDRNQAAQDVVDAFDAES
jgi:hypothetical protein